MYDRGETAGTVVFEVIFATRYGRDGRGGVEEYVKHRYTQACHVHTYVHMYVRTTNMYGGGETAGTVVLGVIFAA